jgi:hypothetical protein
MSVAVLSLAVTIIVALAGWIVSAIAVAVKAGKAAQLLETLAAAVTDLTNQLRIHATDSSTKFGMIQAELARQEEVDEHLDRRVTRLEDTVLPSRKDPR